MKDETKGQARKVFDMWFPIFRMEGEERERERLFDYFHSGYMAGTKHGRAQSGMTQGCPATLIKDDTNRNLDL